MIGEFSFISLFEYFLDLDDDLADSSDAETDSLIVSKQASG